MSARGALPPAQKLMLVGLAAVLVAAQIDQPFAQVAPLHHIPTTLLLLASPFLLKRWPLSNAAIACNVVFFVLHTIGGR